MTSMSWKQVCVAATYALACVCGAMATPFWIAYEANDGLFPEQLGWQRTTYGGGAQRWFEKGCLVLDGLASTGSSDFYTMNAPIALAPGERFVMQWRLRVDEVPTIEDPGINFTVLYNAALTLVYSESWLYSLGEGVWIPFVPGVFHDYLLISEDLDTYRLYIDGNLARYGRLDPTGWESGVRWGTPGRVPGALPGGITCALGWSRSRLAPRCSGPAWCWWLRRGAREKEGGVMVRRRLVMTVVLAWGTALAAYGGVVVREHSGYVRGLDYDVRFASEITILRPIDERGPYDFECYDDVTGQPATIQRLVR